ncbi:MAG: Stealth CR1 domain-containing protein, partial [Puniceicoccales bacterium]|nr:Stealth CR1 domain-containing protein [Puniceicoccales bacterium]
MQINKTMTETYPIDFVLTWVDGNDPVWQEDMKKYYRSEKGVDVSVARSREWDNLRYWFRAIEKFAPWFRTLHFVTWGHLPKWLNTDNPKLHIVKHADFIPQQYLPTFNSWAITWNMWRIEGLAEYFVYFGDDVFLGQQTERSRFFKNGIPCDYAQLAAFKPENPHGHYLLNTLEITHRRHNFRKSILSDPTQWFNAKYSLPAILKNIYLLPSHSFASLKNPHVTSPYLRSEFEKMWQEEYNALDNTCKSKFRTYSDVMHWLVRYERLITGNFSPVGIKDTHTDLITDERAEEIADYIIKQKYRLF